jgi:hypothetical protein
MKPKNESQGIENKGGRPTIKDGSHKERITVTIDPVVNALSSERAMKEGVSRAAIVELALRRYLGISNL